MYVFLTSLGVFQLELMQCRTMFLNTAHNQSAFPKTPSKYFLQISVSFKNNFDTKIIQNSQYGNFFKDFISVCLELLVLYFLTIKKNVSSN